MRTFLISRNGEIDPFPGSSFPYIHEHAYTTVPPPEHTNHVWLNKNNEMIMMTWAPQRAKKKCCSVGKSFFSTHKAFAPKPSERKARFTAQSEFNARNCRHCSLRQALYVLLESIAHSTRAVFPFAQRKEPGLCTNLISPSENL